ncbi:hypothetical protein MMC11_006774 [Xylographa trunciseda]|nr:hypothetical protein [Xylographa trunciseda]
MSQDDEPHVNLNAATEHTASLWQNFSAFPQPVYHLRVSVLHNNEGHGDCPSRMFTFPSLSLLSTATRHIEGTFGGAFSEYTISKDGVEAPDAEGGRRGDGRTEDVVISFDSQTADETWKQFLGRLHKMEGGWVRGLE